MVEKRLGKVLFLLSRAEHPRMWRRVLRLGEYCQFIEVLGFVRKNSPIDHSHKFVSLGTIEHGKFFNRIPVYLNAARKSTSRIQKSDICYSFSLDILVWVYLAKVFTGSKTLLAYEIADIHPVLSSDTLIGKVVRSIERFLVRRSQVVVLTSENFYTGYFKKVQEFTGFKYITIENKVLLPRSVREELPFVPPNDGYLRIGYFGLIKSTRSVEFLIDLAERMQGTVQIKFAGRFVYPNDSDDCLSRIESSSHLEYLGPYRSPEDLESLYQGVDLVWNAYYEGANAVWQRTTRFSESCFFKKPVIFNPDTQDGKLAIRFGLGISVNFDRPDELVEGLKKVDEAWLRGKRANFERLPEKLVFYGDEYESLVEQLVV